MEALEWIDNYFKGQLDQAEKSRFENTVRQDPAFANEVAFYMSSVLAARNASGAERIERFRTLEASRKPAGRVVSLNRYWWASAAAVILVASILVFNRPADVSRMATNYLNEKYNTLGVEMGVSADLNRKGIEAYNQQQYAQAKTLFNQVISREPDNSEAIKNSGLASLQLAEYDIALQQFGKLAALKGLYANPGKFLQAATLMKRNQDGDSEKAKTLLKQVVAEDLEGRATAETWLRTLDK